MFWMKAGHVQLVLTTFSMGVDYPCVMLGVRSPCITLHSPLAQGCMEKQGSPLPTQQRTLFAHICPGRAHIVITPPHKMIPIYSTQQIPCALINLGCRGMIKHSPTTSPLGQTVRTPRAVQQQGQDSISEGGSAWNCPCGPCCHQATLGTAGSSDKQGWAGRKGRSV